MQEIGGEATVEGLFQVRLEGVGTAATGGSLIPLGMAGNNLVEPLTIGCRDVLHIVGILQAAFNLERNGTGLHQLFQVVNHAEVFQRQQVPPLLYHLTVAVGQVEGKAAELGTSAAVGTTAEAILRGIALSAITDAERAMHEDLELNIGHLPVNLADFIDREFPGQHHAAESQRAQPRHLFGSAVVGLGVMSEE